MILVMIKYIFILFVLYLTIFGICSQICKNWNNYMD